jgi:hypothetical protein
MYIRVQPYHRPKRTKTSLKSFPQKKRREGGCDVLLLTTTEFGYTGGKQEQAGGLSSPGREITCR